MAQLTPYTQDQIDGFHIFELGVRDGSSPTLNLDVAGSTAEREFLCDWGSRYDVIRYFLGDASDFVDTGVTKLSRLLPQLLPGRTDFIATKVSRVTGHQWSDFDIDPDDAEEDGSYRFADSTVNRFSCAKLVVQYEKLLWAIKADDAIETELDRFVQQMPGQSTADYLTVPASCQQFFDPAGVSRGNPVGHLEPVPYGVGLTETTYRFSLVWWKVPKKLYGPGSVLWTRIFGDGTV
ncbi:MAG TPA: hypothetical protein VH092_01815, partial [Urbifossiella sp.]|nr:hypothetical protein [Urbifossiella sp.]